MASQIEEKDKKMTECEQRVADLEEQLEQQNLLSFSQASRIEILENKVDKSKEKLAERRKKMAEQERNFHDQLRVKDLAFSKAEKECQLLVNELDDKRVQVINLQAKVDDLAEHLFVAREKVAQYEFKKHGRDFSQQFNSDQESVKENVSCQTESAQTSENVAQTSFVDQMGTEAKALEEVHLVERNLFRSYD